jgi:hypothetical protein
MTSFFVIIIKVTIHSSPRLIRKTSQQAVCRFFEAFRFAHKGGVPASQLD